jgi:hypothetical protein
MPGRSVDEYRAPLFVAWQLTNRCQARCIACCEESGPDKAWRDELARKTYVAILEVMNRPAKPRAEAAAPTKGSLEVPGKMAAAPTSDPVVDAYRRKLSMALF